MAAVQQLTADTFADEVLKSPVPVLVDFYATWCPPCRALAPTLEAIAGEYAGRAKVVKVDVDEAPELAEAFRVESVPTLFIVQDGRAVDGAVGAVSAATLREKLDRLVDAPVPRRRRPAFG